GARRAARPAVYQHGGGRGQRRDPDRSPGGADVDRAVGLADAGVPAGTAVISARNPMKDRVAIASAATTGFTPHNTERSPMSYAAEASIAVLRQCGLSAADVDGICGTVPSAVDVQATLGIPEVTWYANP